MSPDEVATRARELEGTEVLLTVRGVVHTTSTGVWLAAQVAPRWIAEAHVGGALPDLVDIQPAPMRIVAGQLYADEGGEVYIGIDERWVKGFKGKEFSAAGLAGLRPVRVVDL